VALPPILVGVIHVRHPAQVDLVRSSFAKGEPIASDAAVLFYGHLFEARPELPTLFRGDMIQQGHKLRRKPPARRRWPLS